MKNCQFEGEIGRSLEVCDYLGERLEEEGAVRADLEGVVLGLDQEVR